MEENPWRTGRTGRNFKTHAGAETERPEKNQETGVFADKGSGCPQFLGVDGSVKYWLRSQKRPKVFYWICLCRDQGALYKIYSTGEMSSRKKWNKANESRRSLRAGSISLFPQWHEESRCVKLFVNWMYKLRDVLFFLDAWSLRCLIARSPLLF